MIHKTLLFFVSFVLLGCSSQSNNKFYLHGVLPESIVSGNITLIYEDSIIGQSPIINGKFEIEGQIDHPCFVQVNCEGCARNTYFWLEPGDITFRCANSDLNQKIIEGSEAQKVLDAQHIYVDGIRQEINALRERPNEYPLNGRSRKMVFDSLLNVRYILEQECIKNYPNSMASVRILDIYKSQWGASIVKELYEIMGHKKNTLYDQRIKNFLEFYKSNELGDIVDNFNLPDSSGNLIALADIQAQLIYIDFWTSWCRPCRESFPEMQSIYSKYQKDGFEIIGVSLDVKKEWWLKALEDDKITWPNLWDKDAMDGPIAYKYGVVGLPTNYLVDENGLILAKNLNPQKLSEFLGSYYASNP